MKSKNTKTIKFIDLFSGMGGLRLGFEEGVSDLGLNSQCVLTSEIKKHAVKVLNDNFQHGKMVGDIKCLEDEEIPAFDVLLAGFPCQPFSTAGKRLGFYDTRGTLFFEIERILRAKKPKAFILENVPGLIKHDFRKDEDEEIGRTFKIILSNLKSIGYNVDWVVLNAKDFGIPQNRERVFIIGNKDEKIDLKNLKEIEEIEVSRDSTKLKDIFELGVYKDEAIDNSFTRTILNHFKPEDLYGKKINDKRGGKNNIHSWDLELKGEVSKKQKRLMSDLLRFRRQKRWAEDLKIAWSDGMPLTEDQIFVFAKDYYEDKDFLKKDLEDLKDKGYLRLEHPKDIVERDGVRRREYREDLPMGYNIVAGKLSFKFTTILDPNSIAPTLTATDIDRIAVVDEDTLRELSILELKRLFGFPEDFIIDVSKDEAYDLFGNTIAIPVVREIVKYMKI